MQRRLTVALLTAVATLAACKGDKEPRPATSETAPVGAGTTAGGGSAAAATPSGGAPVGGASAGSSQPPPAARPLTDEEVDALGGRLLAFTESLASAIEANPECGAMATAVEKTLADHRSLFEENRSAQGSPGNDAKFEAWMAKQETRVEAVGARLERGAEQCATDPRMLAAFAKIDL